MNFLSILRLTASVIETVRRVTGLEIPLADAPHWPGDPPRLVVDANKERSVLGWQPRYADLETIVAHAWAWEQKWPWSAN